ncbi:MAG TPA: hypothetical protein PLV57_14485 [Phycisphaerae bacterium]|nr:hypothetical protein [Phycisphaerae bacterium]HPP27717.1 hypothetical protein [Phycisphaerae bacterium]
MRLRLSVRATGFGLCGMAGVLLLQLSSTTWATAPASTQPAVAAAEPLPHTNTVFKPVRYERRKQWEWRRTWLRDQVRLAAGLIPEWPRTPLNAKIFGKLIRDGYTVEKVYFESSPGIYVTGNLYRPASEPPPGGYPVVACPHGHWQNGRLHHDDRGSVPARCITLARNGAVVFAYDMVGYNDSARMFKHGDPHLDTPQTVLWGIGHFQLQTLNSIRVLDFLQSLPGVNRTRIGVTGASGGGTQTFILSAVDDRVAVDCPVNMISSTMQGGCICENAPLLRIGTNNMEIAAVFAPKPRLMVSATGDWTKLTPEVEYPFVRSIYELYDAADRIENVHIDAPHNYNLQSRQAMYRFFGRELLNSSDPDAIQETDIPVEKPEDMLVWSDDNVPANLPDAERVVALMKQRINEQVESLRDRPAYLAHLARLWLRHAAGRYEPDLAMEQTVVPGDGNEDTLEFKTVHGSQGRQVTSISRVGRAFASAPRGYVFMLDPAGLAAATKYDDFAQTLIKAGHCVVFVEPFGTGGNRRDPASTQPADRHKFFTTFNPTDDALAVDDIATVVAQYAIGSDCHVTLVGFDRMGPLCVLARALLSERPHHLRVVADLNGRDWNDDQTYLEQLFIPLIRRFGGLPVLAAVPAKGALWLHNTGGKFDANWLKGRADTRIQDTPASPDEIATWLTATNAPR